MMKFATNNIYYCKLIKFKNNDVKYSFATRIIKENGKIIYYDIIDNKQLEIVNTNCCDMDKYYIIRISKLNLPNNKISLKKIRKAFINAPKIEDEINKLYDNKIKKHLI